MKKDTIWHKRKLNETRNNKMHKKERNESCAVMGVSLHTNANKINNQETDTKLAGREEEINKKK